VKEQKASNVGVEFGNQHVFNQNKVNQTKQAVG
jgi:hypothetical protein